MDASRTERTRPTTAAYAAVKAAAIVIGVGLAYYALCALNPALSNSTGFGAALFGGSFRIANTLRALALVSPEAAIGTGVGAWLWNLSSGRAVVAAWPVLPAIAAGLGLVVHILRKQIRRPSVWKDIALLASYGAVWGLIVSLHWVSLAAIADIELWTPLLTMATAYKVATSALIVVLGYPLVKVWELVIDRG